MTVLSWLRMVGRKYFCDIGTAAKTIFAMVGSLWAAYAGTTLVTKIVDTLAGNTPYHIETLSWAVFVYILSLGGAAVFFWRRSADIESQNRLLRRGFLIQHKMAEQVRQAAILGDTYDPRELQKALGHDLQRFLQDYLGTTCKIHITVKRVNGDKLEAIYRDADQPRQRIESNVEDLLNTNSIYFYFKTAKIGEDRVIHIPDVDKGSAGELKERAKARGYRTIMAFPINIPPRELEPKLQMRQLVGFLGVDCRDPGIFGKFFKSDTISVSVDYSNESELDIFYGLADSVASLIELKYHNKNVN